MKTVNSVKRAGKTVDLCLKAIALNVLKVDLAVSDKSITLNRLK